jgi:AcrR family transcriptional regulator
MRVALVDAAEQLIRDEGYPAVTARNLAERVNLSRQIVHYYFHTMDDVFIAVIRKNAERLQAQLEEARHSDEPLRTLQKLNRDPAQAILAMELNALANRRPAVRAEVVRAAKEARALQTRLLTEHLRARGMAAGMKPIVATVLLTGLAQVLALEAAIDMTSGHAETLEFVDVCLRAFAEGRDVPFPNAPHANPRLRDGRKPSGAKAGRMREKLRRRTSSS